MGDCFFIGSKFGSAVRAYNEANETFDSAFSKCLASGFAPVPWDLNKA